MCRSRTGMRTISSRRPSHLRICLKIKRRPAVALAERIADGLDLVGILAVEMFQTPDGGILVNELAPRPHNSGHWTIDACLGQPVRTDGARHHGYRARLAGALRRRGDGQSPG